MLLVKTKIDRSVVAGVGLFADEDLKKGSVVWKFAQGFDLEYDKADLDKLSDSARAQFLNYCFYSQKTGKYVLPFDDARFFNHSETPNVIDKQTGERYGVDVAARDIRKGEELTNDYREFDGDFTRKPIY